MTPKNRPISTATGTELTQETIIAKDGPDMPLSLRDQVSHMTTRIEVTNRGGEISYGSGFFYFACYEEGGASIPLVVTNKHVMAGANRVTITFTRSVNDMPTFEIMDAHIDEDNLILIDHPSEDVDITAFIIGGTLKALEEANFQPYFRPFTMSNIPSQEEIAEFTAIENLLMIGYPNGLWDPIHNVPLVRQGLTSTPYAVDYCNKPEFVIDAACFPGSSGSPIIFVNHVGRLKRNGQPSFGSKPLLLGILYAGPTFDAEGEVSTLNIPTAGAPVITQMMINLGNCLKSRLLLDIERICSEIPRDT